MPVARAGGACESRPRAALTAIGTGRVMRGSCDHILTSHAGSLPRPDALIEAWGANDEPALSFELRAAVAEVAHRLAELAIAGNVDAAVPLAAHTEVDAFLTNCRIAIGIGCC